MHAGFAGLEADYSRRPLSSAPSLSSLDVPQRNTTWMANKFIRATSELIRLQLVAVGREMRSAQQQQRGNEGPNDQCDRDGERPVDLFEIQPGKRQDVEILCELPQQTHR